MANTIPANNNTGLYNTLASNVTPINANVYATNISASGNVTVGGYIVSNGSITTNSNFVGNLIGNVTGNVNGNISGNFTLSSGNTQVVYNNNGYTAGSPAFTFDQSANVVSVVGNISSQYFIGNGALLTGISGGGSNYSNANATSLLANFGSNNISTTGNITSGYVFGNGSQLTGITTNYSNANVQAYLPTYTGNLNPNTVSASGNVTATNIQTSGAFGNITGANYVQATYFVGDGSQLSNIAAANVTGTFASVSATGNVSGAYILGNGSQLTGITANYSNANVVSLLAAFGSNTISTTGAVTTGNLSVPGGNITATNIQAGQTITAIGNITGGNVLTSGQVSAAGTVKGSGLISGAVTYSATDGTAGQVLTTYGNGQTYFSTVSGNGGGSYGNANVAAYLPTYTGSLDSVTGNIGTANTSANINIAGSGNLVIGSSTGNVRLFAANTGSNVLLFSTSTGNINFGVNATVVSIAASASNTTVNGNLYVASGSLRTTNSTGNVFTTANTINLGTLSATGVNIGAANVTVTVGSSANGAQGNVVAGNVIANNNISAYGNIYGVNYVFAPYFVGNVNASNVQGTVPLASYVTSNAQANITSVGILTSLSSSGNITAPYFIGNGSALTGITTTYSNANVTTLLAAFGSNTISTTGTVNSGNVTAPYFFGNGSQLTGLPATYTNANVVNLLLNFGSNAISTTGTVNAGNVTSSGFFFGNGGGLSNLQGSNVVGSVPTAQTVTNGSQPNITAVGTLTAVNTSGTISATGDITTAGNLTTGLDVVSSGNVIATAAITGANVTGSSSLSVTGATLLQASAGLNDSIATNKTSGAVNIGTAASMSGAINIGASTANQTINIGASTVGAANTKTINIGSGTGSGTTNINIGQSVGGGGLGVVTINNGSVVNIGNTSGSALSVVGGISTSSLVSAAGNVTGGNILTAGIVSATGKITAGAVTYANTDGTAGQVLTTYGNGQTYFSTVSGGSYGNSNVTTLLAAFGSNTISTTGAVSTGNITLPTFGRLFGDYSNATISSRTALQNSSNNFTAFNVIPGQGYNTTGTGTLASLSVYSSSDAGNASFVRLIQTPSDGRFVTGVTGSGAQLPMTFVVNGTTNAMQIATSGNITANASLKVTNTLTFANIAQSGGTPASATDLVIAYKIPIVINGTTYYIALTAGQ